MKEFTKSDLKIGMVVETRGSDLYFFIGNNKLISGYMCNDFTEWNENLTYNLNNDIWIKTENSDERNIKK